MISFPLDIVESALVGSVPNSCNGAARLPFKAGLAYLLCVLWPVNLALFKPSPHVLEPTWVGQSSERRCGQMCGPCGLDRGPFILYSWPCRPTLSYLWNVDHAIRPTHQSNAGKSRVFKQVKALGSASVSSFSRTASCAPLRHPNRLHNLAELDRSAFQSFFEQNTNKQGGIDE
jgi:hypothetical protein